MFTLEQLMRIYREEAADGSGGSSGVDQGAEDQGQETGQEEGGQQPQGSDRPEWLLDKYATDGRSQEEAISEQAKAYNELQGRFGSFTGAPEEYEAVFSDELKEAGLELNADDPLLQEAMKFAKESNMSQEGFNGMLNLYGMQMLADEKALEEYKANEMKQLGANAQSRIDNIDQWANKNLDPETYKAVQGIATSAEAVKALERIIGMTRSAPASADNATPAPGVTAEEVRKMQFEKDEHGNRRIQTDPEFRARYNKLRNEVYGTDDFKVVVR